MRKNTPILLDRLSAALARHGATVKRTHLLQVAAQALGRRNTHELTAADEAGELDPPEARLLGRHRIAGTGPMLFLQDPDGAVFAIDEESFDAQRGRAADWIISPLGGLLDVSALRTTNASAETAPDDDQHAPIDFSGLEGEPPRAAPDERECGAVGEDAIRHLAIRSPLNRLIYKALRGYGMGNMVYDEEHGAPYALVDLMSNPAPSDIGTGEMEMISLADEIEQAITGSWTPFDVTGTQKARPSASRVTAIPAHAAATTIDPGIPAYMTNACCERASVSRDDLVALGLPFGSFEGEFYPLTDAEAEYIGEDVVDAADGLHGAMTGYTVLYRGAKHLAPTIEIHNAAPGDGRGEDFPSRDEAVAEATAYAARIRTKVEDMGGAVLLDASQHDRIEVMLLVPFDRVVGLYTRGAWLETLASLMVDPSLPEAILEPVSFTGDGWRTSVRWIGEGDDGDWNPRDPDDRPLLRFDVERRVGGEWEPLEGGSWCSGVPAYCTREEAAELARLVTEGVAMAGHARARRTAEAMSGTGIDAVRAALPIHHADDAARMNASAARFGAEANGTSIVIGRDRGESLGCMVRRDRAVAGMIEDAADGRAVVEWLRTIESDTENAEGANPPAVALAPQWGGRPGDAVRWMLVPEGEDETEWFLDTPPNAPFERRFVRFEEMTVGLD